MRNALAAVIMFCWMIPAFAGPVSDASTALEMWSPISIEKQGATLNVVLPQRSITDQIYKAAMLSGLCLHVQYSGIRLDGIREIEILNQFGAQGYVFEGGANECRGLGELMSDGAYIRLLGQTHWY